MDHELCVLFKTLDKLEGESFVPDSLWETVTGQIKEFLLCEQSYGEDRPSKEEDFEEHKTKSLTGLKYLLCFLKTIERFPEVPLEKQFVVWSVLLCGEHTSSNLWTTSESMEASTHCLGIIFSKCNCKSTSDLLVSGTHSQPLINHLLLSLRPKLLKDTWRKYPAAVHCYQWILLQIKSLHLPDYVNAVLPTALIVLDDHVPSRRRIGLVCLTHIVQNVPRTELCSQGLDNMLYHTLKPLLLQREPELVGPVYTCMTTLLANVEQGYTKSDTHGEQWGRLESTLLTLLRNMDFEDRLIFRLAYVKCLEPILRSMGPSVVQLSKKLLSVFEEYLDKQTKDTRHFAILAFETYIYNSDERMPSNGEKILYLLLRTLYDLTKEMTFCDICAKTTVVSESEISQGNSAGKCAGHFDDLQVVVKCIQFMKKSAPSQFELIRQDVRNEVNFNPLLTDIVETLF